MILVAFLMLTPGAVTAQTPAEDAASVAFGGGVGWLFMSPGWTTAAVRVSAATSTRFGFDVEIGRSLDPSECCRTGEGLAVSTLVRLSRSGRRPDGLTRYWLLGGTYLEQRHVSADGNLIDREPGKAVQVGYGWD